MARARARAVGNHGRPAMSDEDRPRNPFGRGDRTIIRPNPGGRLPTPPGANPLPGQSSPNPTPPALPTPAPPAPQHYAPAPATPTAEEWIQTAAPPPAAAAPAYAQGPMLRVDELAA